jgi:hypothetical protein
MNLETIEYKGWNCVRLANEKIEVVVTLDVGPRIIRCGFLNGPNFFKEYSDTLGVKSGDEWNIFGGHRLWHAPENDPRTYAPDNAPIEWEEVENGARFMQPVEATTGIQKEIEVRLPDDEARVEVEHFLTNKGVWPVELAPWALSVMDVGGVAIIPLPPRGTHPEELLPTSSITIWPFTHMNDERWTWGEKYILLRQNEQAPTPQKIGVRVPDGWAAYANNNQLFVKTFDYYEDETYPDFGSVVETFTNHEMLELETLAPTTKLEPGDSDFHLETWHLFDGVSTPQNEAEVEEHVLPQVREIQS